MLLTDDLGALGVPVIRREDRLRAFDRLRVPPVATLSHATVIRLGQVVGAAQVVIGSFQLDGQNLIVRARTIRLDTGRISAELIERGPLNDLLNIYERLARRIGPANVPDTALTRTLSHAAGVRAVHQGTARRSARHADRVPHPGAQVVSRLSARARRALGGAYGARGAQGGAGDREGRAGQQSAVAAGTVPRRRVDDQPRAAPGGFDALTALNRDRPDPALLNNLGVIQLRRPRLPASRCRAVPRSRISAKR